MYRLEITNGLTGIPVNINLVAYLMDQYVGKKILVSFNVISAFSRIRVYSQMPVLLEFIEMNWIFFVRRQFELTSSKVKSSGTKRDCMIWNSTKLEWRYVKLRKYWLAIIFCLLSLFRSCFDHLNIERWSSVAAFCSGIYSSLIW